MISLSGMNGTYRTLAGTRRLLALLAIAASAACAGACGGSGTGARSASHTSSRATTTATSSSASGATPTSDYTKVDSDKDNDVGAPADDKSNPDLSVGQAASAPDRRAVTALLERYYAVALAENGKKACGLIYSPFAESVPETFGTSNPPGPPYMRGTTCAAVVTGLFKHLHAQLAVELPKLAVTRVRLVEHHGLAVLSFGKLPERVIHVVREGRVWRVVGLIDEPVP